MPFDPKQFSRRLIPEHLRRSLPRPRLLPVVIAACALAAPLYAAGVAARNQAQPEETGTPGSVAVAAPAPAVTAAAPAASNAAGMGGVTDLLATPPAGAPSALVAPAVAAASCEPGLADLLAAERKALADRRAELEIRAQMLSAAEAKAREQMARLEAAGKEVTSLLDRRASMAKADLQRLVAIYENMKPKDAARLLNETEPEILVDLLDLMQERRSAPILAEMDAGKVNALTRTMAQRRVLPADRPAATEKNAAIRTGKPSTQTASLPAR